MRIRLSILIFCFCLYFRKDTFCQPTSFQISMDIVGHRLGDVVVNENDEIMAIFYGSPFTIPSFKCYLMELTEGALSQEAVQFSSPGTTQFSLLRNALYYGQKTTWLQFLTLGSSGGLSVINYNVSNGETWIRKSNSNSGLGDFVVDELENIVFLHDGGSYASPDIALLYCLDSLGHSNWSKTLRLSKPGFDALVLEAKEIGYLPGEGYYISGKFSNYNNSGLDEYFVMKLNLAGTPVIMKTIGEHAISQLYTGNDGVYLLGKSTATFPFTNNSGNAVLARFNSTLEFEWAIVYHAEAFEYARATLNLAADGTLVLGYSTFGAYPVVLARLDATGNILWQKGYPLYEPQIDALSDGSLLLTTPVHFDSTGALFSKMIIARTDPNGNIQGCPTFPSCLKSSPLTLSIGTFQAEVLPADTLQYIDILTEPAQFTFSEFCDIPPPPSPAFGFPDSLCLGDSTSTSNTYNTLAHKTEWRLSGNGIDSTWTDSLSFHYRFHTPGQYTLEQSVWFLGCRYTSSQEITVLDSLQAVILPSGTVCEFPPLALYVSANREPRNFFWSTSSADASVEITESGTYAVLVSDGYCLALDSTEIELVALQFGNDPPLALPPDTALCPLDLPWLLYPQSNYSNSFFLDGKLLENIPIELFEEGEYRIAINVEGCLFTDTFSLEIKDCETAVYLPNVFSPNGDGINDLFFPQGKNFIPLALSIYDRWGGKLFRAEGSALQWEGRGAAQGVYVYVLEYLDLISQNVEFTRGTVTLMK